MNHNDQLQVLQKSTAQLQAALLAVGKEVGELRREVESLHDRVEGLSEVAENAERIACEAKDEAHVARG